MKVGPHLGQAGQLVLELGQLYLKTALVGLGVLGEDVENQARAVDDLGLDRFFQGTLLGRRKLVVGDQNRVAGLGLGRDQLVDLAFADVVVGIQVAAVLPLRTHHLSAGGVGQACQLPYRLLCGPSRVVTGVHGDEKCALFGRRQIDHVLWHTDPA